MGKESVDVKVSLIGCGAVSPGDPLAEGGYRCTRPKEHHGNHEARGWDFKREEKSYVIEEWA